MLSTITWCKQAPLSQVRVSLPQAVKDFSAVYGFDSTAAQEHYRQVTAILLVAIGRLAGHKPKEAETMADEWAADVKNYVADPDEKVIAGIVRYCGIALRNRDSSLVSFSDKEELARVRENFLKKKLGCTEDDATLDKAIASVGEKMKGTRNRNRVTVYYLLAEHFGKLDLFR